MLKTFIPDLKRHLLRRIQQLLLGNQDNTFQQQFSLGVEFAEDDHLWQSVIFDNDRIFAHQLVRIKYTLILLLTFIDLNFDE